MAARFCEQLAVLNHGKIIACGEPQKILSNDLIKTVYDVQTFRTLNPHTDTPCLDFY